jgi:3-hydroxyacyl-[acyl-carrier-protein] dehydratase
MKIDEIQNVLPHRYPMLLVDRILSVEPGKRAVGLKNVTINESFFEGHFPGHPVMPGVLLIESMAQVGGVILLSTEGNGGKLVYLVGLDKVRFRKPVIPGDRVITEVEQLGQRGNFGKVKAVARVDGEIVAECVILYSVVDSPAGETEGAGRGKRAVSSSQP